MVCFLSDLHVWYTPQAEQVQMTWAPVSSTTTGYLPVLFFFFLISNSSTT